MKLLSLIEEKGNEAYRFAPTNNFYKIVGISKKRFWQIARNEKPANLDELKTLAQYFDIPITDIID